MFISPYNSELPARGPYVFLHLVILPNYIVITQRIFSANIRDESEKSECEATQQPPNTVNEGEMKSDRMNGFYYTSERRFINLWWRLRVPFAFTTFLWLRGEAVIPNKMLLFLYRYRKRAKKPHNWWCAMERWTLYLETHRKFILFPCLYRKPKRWT